MITKKDSLAPIEGNLSLRYDWEAMQRYDDLYRIFKASHSADNIRPFGDITNTHYGRLCQEYNEYQLLKLKKRLKKRKK